MIDKHTIFEIHRLNNLNWSVRKIARTLRIDRQTVKTYIENPDQSRKNRAKRGSKLDAYQDLIETWLEKDPHVKAPVVLQRLYKHGFDGKITIVRDYLLRIRGPRKQRVPFIRFESLPAEQMQIDWGHFDSLTYGETKRKLYALAVIESYSRMLYVEFTHSQKQASLHQALLNAFIFFGGTPKEILVDNMVTAVIERKGSVVRFNDAFLDFLRIFKITPLACNPAAPHEKGKVEAAIKYIRQNFWPLRSFEDLLDVQRQARQWLNAVANVRIHRGTGQRPWDRFNTVKLNPLPDLLPDCREVLTVKVHKDFAVRFDGNTYTTPPWTIGKKLTLKADENTVTLYLEQKKIATHRRCFKRHMRIESKTHQEQVKKLKNRLWQDRQIVAFASLGSDARAYLQGLIEAKAPIRKNITKILTLKDEYGSAAIIAAIEKALTFNAYGSDYIENILYQEMTPQKHHPPVKLKNDDLNRICLTEPALTDYDAHILKRRKKDD